MKRVIFTVFFMIAGLFFAPQAQAFDIRSGDAVVVGSGETIKGTLLVAGQSVKILGRVEGDIYCAGQSIAISGEVTGDILCAGQKVTVSGRATDVRVVGQDVDLMGDAGGSMFSAGQNVSLSEASVSGDLIFLGQNLSLSGVIDKSVLLRGEEIRISGRINEDADLEADKITLLAGSTVGRALTYAAATFEISPEAKVIGPVTVRNYEKSVSGKDRPHLPRLAADRVTISGLIRSILPLLLIAYIYALIFPGSYRKTVEAAKTRPLRSFLLGLVFLFMAPGIFLGLIFTLIGIPLAILFAFFSAIALYVSRIITAVLIGRYLTETIGKGEAKNIHWPILIGIPVFVFITRAPVVGPFIHLLSVVIGVGAFAVSKETRIVKARSK